ncbi:hypothetical protein L2E82_01184 [Cichorium intybus]|uniref:Uncharacterized protein n=1 Tax=Cichorium intybus TaxID=13427 RepID=A0ACB9GZB1_CICIN|nr:hypothetical protein L2E82_01184 [Cichorium intybus]
MTYSRKDSRLFIFRPDIVHKLIKFKISFMPFDQILIIFVEDFGRFAGVRGKFIHTKKQDHKAFITQLLVDLDGLEKQDGFVLMATTRNLKQMDEALQHPGCMDRIFYLQRPMQIESSVPTWLRKTKLTKAMAKMITNSVEYLNPPLDVGNWMHEDYEG